MIECDEEWVLRGGRTVMRLCKYEDWFVERTLQAEAVSER